MMIWYTDSRASVCPSSTVPTGWAKPLAEGSAEEVEVGFVELVGALVLVLVLELVLELDGDGDELEVVYGVEEGEL